MIRTLIVDDEPIARTIIEGYSVHIPELQIVGSVDNALEAKKVLDLNKVDLILLDINMPVLSGLSFVKTMKDPPIIVFTTAYKEFAHQAYDLAAIDYLLKPFPLDRFIVAVDKVKQLMTFQSPLNSNLENNDEFIFLKSGGIIHKFVFDSILYIEASGNSTKIKCGDKIILINDTMTSIGNLLPSLFAKCHRSFIINKSKISHIEGNRVFIDNKEIPIGAGFKEGFLKELGL